MTASIAEIERRNFELKADHQQQSGGDNMSLAYTSRPGTMGHDELVPSRDQVTLRQNDASLLYKGNKQVERTAPETGVPSLSKSFSATLSL
jgi:hypothetical protein